MDIKISNLTKIVVTKAALKSLCSFLISLMWLAICFTCFDSFAQKQQFVIYKYVKTNLKFITVAFKEKKKEDTNNTWISVL